MGGGTLIRFWHRRRNESRTSAIARIYVLAGFWWQIAISGALLGVGLFFLVFYENYLFSIGLVFGYYYLLVPLNRVMPHLMIIGAGIGFLFAYYWFKMANRSSESSGALILSALVYLAVVGVFIGPVFSFLAIVMAGPRLHAILIHGVLYMDAPLFLNFLIVLALVVLPALIVLVAGGGVYLYKYLSAPPLRDSTVDVSPRGVRTSHSVLVAALRQEKDKERKTSSREKH